MPPTFGETRTDPLARWHRAPQYGVASRSPGCDRPILPSGVAFAIATKDRLETLFPKRENAGGQPCAGRHFGKQTLPARVGKTFHGAAYVARVAA